MLKPKIFISHSAKDKFAQDARSLLVTKLKEKNFDILLDVERIAPGEKWRGKLYKWLGECHGAIILFSRDALQSDWVFIETTILTWRKALQPNLQLMPVLIGNIKPEDTRLDRYKPIQLNEIQFARLDPKKRIKAEIDRLVDQIDKHYRRFSCTDNESWLKHWLLKVEAFLCKIDPSYLEIAGDLLNIHKDDWCDDIADCIRTIAHRLISIDLAEARPVLLELAEDRNMPKDLLPDFLDLIIPTCVQMEAARNILPITKLEMGRRFLAINGQRLDTGVHYIRRATCCKKSIICLKADDITGEMSIEEVVAKYDKAFQREFNIPQGSPVSYIHKGIQMAVKAGEPLFMLIGRDLIEPSILKALRERYPEVTFVLMSGENFPDRKEVGIPDLELIYPELGLDRELEAYLKACMVKKISEIS